MLARAPGFAPNDALVLHPLISGLDKEISWKGLRLLFGEVAPHVDIRQLCDRSSMPYGSLLSSDRNVPLG
jgi:hypothetical protein